MLSPGFRRMRGYTLATGEHVYRGEYHWPDYKLGPLVIERGLARNMKTYENYDAAWKVRIESKTP